LKLKDYLIASEANEYRPWITKPEALAVFCVVIWSLRIFVPATIGVAAGGIDPQDLMNKVNYERTQRYIPALIANDKLNSAASAKAHDMIERSYFAHVDPDGNYVWPRIEGAGYKPYSTLGENLAMDFTSAGAVVSAWMNSPTHRANIVNEKFEDQGMSTASGTFEPGHDTIMIVNLFGTLYRPKTTPAPQPSQPTPQQPAQHQPSQKPSTPASQPSPTHAPTPAKEEKISISNELKVSQTTVSGKALINVTTAVAGSPTLVTAQLKTQSITMLAGKTAGEFTGVFTFDQGEDLANQTLTVEARSKAGAKTSISSLINFETGVTGAKEDTTIPVSSESRILTGLRILFGILALCYTVFLLIDAIIIHRAKIKRPGLRSGDHTMLFLLVAIVSIFFGWR